MFEYVQERDMESRLEPRTLIYVITCGEVKPGDSSELSKRGKNQIVELANSRLVAGVRRIYSSSSQGEFETAKILSKEFNVRVHKEKCLGGFEIGIPWNDEDMLREELTSLWNDETYSLNGECLADARERFGTCLNKICMKHPDDSVAIIGDTILTTLFHSLVTAAPIDINSWLSTGFASCATYEYTKTGWTLVMPPENSFLTDPSSVSDWLPDNLF